ncbi:MAG: hypothetical protein PHU23_07475 [Dehalococcoidales bacterium]|nr:hypothetical protein [Dehalococcoidales bacterium]
MSNQERNIREATERAEREAAEAARQAREREAADMSRRSREATERAEREAESARHMTGTTGGVAAGTAARQTTDTTARQVRGEEPVTWDEMRAQLRREPGAVEETFKPTLGGILAIIAGSWNVITGGAALFGATFIDDLLANFNITGAAGGAGTTIGTGIGIALLVLGLISIIGGIMAIARRAWWFAMLGAIVAMIPTPIILPFIMGFFATLFTGLGKREFDYKAR